MQVIRLKTISCSIYGNSLTKFSLLNTFLIIVCGNFRILCKSAVDNRSTMGDFDMSEASLIGMANQSSKMTNAV